MATARSDKYFAPLSRLLVPTDFSPGAKWSLQRALLLPLAHEASLHLLHVLPSVPLKKRAMVRAAAEVAMEELVEFARGKTPELEVSFELVSGEAYVEIIRCARRVGSELIVIGRHSRRPLRDLVIGSTAARVIRKVDVPVLAVASEPKHAYRRPCIATDLEDTSSRTLELALRVAGRQVKVFHVVHAFNVPFEGFVTPTLSAREESEYRRDFRHAATKGLNELLARYQVGVDWKKSIHAGDARLVLMEAVGRSKADLIALGTHGRSGVSHALVGSVAEWVISAAPCDVLVGRPVRFTFEPP